MSVDFYMACEKCRKAIHVAQDGLGGFAFYSGEPACMKALGPFLAEHVLCGRPTLMAEQYVEDYDEVEWASLPAKG